eukprot:4914720-Pyramimonas_sp.AAC.1
MAQRPSANYWAVWVKKALVLVLRAQISIGSMTLILAVRFQVTLADGSISCDLSLVAMCIYAPMRGSHAVRGIAANPIFKLGRARYVSKSLPVQGVPVAKVSSYVMSAVRHWAQRLLGRGCAAVFLAF